jgi:hypothetical protein
MDKPGDIFDVDLRGIDDELNNCCEFHGIS